MLTAARRMRSKFCPDITIFPLSILHLLSFALFCFFVPRLIKETRRLALSYQPVCRGLGEGPAITREQTMATEGRRQKGPLVKWPRAVRRCPRQDIGLGFSEGQAMKQERDTSPEAAGGRGVRVRGKPGVRRAAAGGGRTARRGRRLTREWARRPPGGALLEESRGCAGRVPRWREPWPGCCSAPRATRAGGGLAEGRACAMALGLTPACRGDLGPRAGLQWNGLCSPGGPEEAGQGGGPGAGTGKRGRTEGGQGAIQGGPPGGGLPPQGIRSLFPNHWALPALPTSMFKYILSLFFRMRGEQGRVLNLALGLPPAPLPLSSLAEASGEKAPVPRGSCGVGYYLAKITVLFGMCHLYST